MADAPQSWRRSLVMLLQHGPLTAAEVLEITGWRCGIKYVRRLLGELRDEGAITMPKKGVYQA